VLHAAFRRIPPQVTLVPRVAIQCWSCLMEGFHQGWDVFTHHPAFAKLSGVDGDAACRRELESAGAAGHKMPPAAWSEAAPALPWPEKWSDVDVGGASESHRNSYLYVAAVPSGAG